MRLADAIPLPLLPAAAAVVAALRDDGDVERLTGLSPARWRELACSFPGLGEDPGRRAGRARLRLGFLAGRALATPRHAPHWRGGPPDARPTLYVTAHIGDLRALRYLVRRRTPAASVVPDAEHRPRFEREDALREQSGWAFPHAFSASRPHRLRTALRSGSLIVAADRPRGEGRTAEVLGGRIRLDPGPLRLASLARVPARALFLTAPGGRLTVTRGEPLPPGVGRALDSFAEALARVGDESPSEWDGVTLWSGGAERLTLEDTVRR